MLKPFSKDTSGRLELIILTAFQLIFQEVTVYRSRRFVSIYTILLSTSFAGITVCIHTSVRFMPAMLLLPMILTPVYRDKLMTLFQAVLLILLFLADSLYFIPNSPYSPPSNLWIEVGVFITCSIATYVLPGRVNDTFGHAFGDEVIKCVSTIFEKNCPADAICARYGGEEFAMILPGSTPKTTAEHIRLDFSSHLFDTPMGEKSFTISLGTAVYDRSYAGATPFFEKADQALYEAKRSGKNRVV